MASYIGKVSINGTNEALVGSTLYGICDTAAGTAAKTVGSTDTTNTDLINTNYDRLVRGTTIHVKFNNGNTATSGVTLAVGTTLAQTVVGIHECAAGTILSFTLDENQNWVVNDNVDTNTEYEFMTAYNASTNKVATASDLTALNIQDAAHKDVVTDISTNTTSTDLPTAAAVASYVQTQTSGLSGLTGAMHFKGAVTEVPPATGSYESGDVVLGPNDKEYVYNGTDWIELGDEGSYVLQSSQSTTSINNVTGLTGGTLPTLTPTSTTASLVTVVPGTAPSLSTDTADIPIVTQAGTATTASVSGGILTITIGSDTELRQTNASVISTVSLNAGTTPSTVTSTDVTFGAVGDNSFNGGVFPTVASSPVTVVVPVTTP